MDTVCVPRIYADDEGASHFDVVELPLQMVRYAPTVPAFGASSPLPAHDALFASTEPGWSGDWHPSPSRQLYIVLRGEAEIEASDGEMRRFGPGDYALVEDTTGVGHRSRVVGEDTYVNLFVRLA